MKIKGQSISKIESSVYIENDFELALIDKVSIV